MTLVFQVSVRLQLLPERATDFKYKKVDHSLTGIIKMSKRFKGKVAIVTGSAQGIGAVLAGKFAQEGGTVVLADRSPLVQEVAQKIQASGGTASAVEVALEAYSGADRKRPRLNSS